MRAPISWLSEFVDLPDGVTLEHVHAALVRVGLEEEDVHTFDLTGPIVVGQVLSFDDEPQSNGKTIRWCQVRRRSRDDACAASCAAPTTSWLATRSSCRCRAPCCQGRSPSQHARRTATPPTA